MMLPKMRGIPPSTALATLPLSLLIAACGETPPEPAAEEPRQAADFATEASCQPTTERVVRIDGGTFAMGQEGIYAEEGPVRQTQVDGFWIDSHEVTNRRFAAFVADTQYVTLAEKPVPPELYGVPAEQIPPELLLPGSAVFTPPERPSMRYADWWTYVPGANWRKPYGPDGPEAQPDQPVVHLAFEDMLAFAEWAGGRLPSEAEWEFAASAGQPPVTQQPDGQSANSWQGAFPAVNLAEDGFSGIAPVGCFAANANGLYDMIGNVWEVTADYYAPGHEPADTVNPRGPGENAAYDPLNPVQPSRVMKGGSYLCAPNYCQRYRPAARQGRDPGLGASNVGFRLAYDAAPES
ncbi:formylglycine-generating enzyme family protein [Aurantiacibacter sp. MUD11]|uniref:formylglycine-generating enzyme family protein n=1 Tax=Aurantiacibacter sp. MUD11 TaxID=3003265 RepID=UPI0022AA0548|nr:formylglycine-generating enzyme family protein [Aurantiacibacter sp. MUD11]WAT17720.1 formylglycine-generating enzyme family protein [Aurantiacibacter sp. MUD11]